MQGRRCSGSAPNTATARQALCQQPVEQRVCVAEQNDDPKSQTALLLTVRMSLRRSPSRSLLCRPIATGHGASASCCAPKFSSIYSVLQVTVTAHPASSLLQDGHSYVGSEQWRVMRFNDITRQSVNRVRVVHDGHHDTPESRPDCLAFPYLRTMAASGTVTRTELHCGFPACVSLFTTLPPDQR